MRGVFLLGLLLAPGWLHAEEISSTIETIEIRGSEIYPTLEERQLGEPNRDSSGAIKQWNRALPFFAQDVIELGFDLPNPYGIAIIPNATRQELVLSDLEIGINGNRQAIDFVDFERPEVENYNVQLKVDAWVLPFMNVYATIGKMRGDSDIALGIEGSDLLEFLGLDCSGLRPPSACFRTFRGVADLDYDGTNYALGMNLAMGWHQFFVTLPITYTWADLDIVSDYVEALHISPRFGVTANVEELGMIAVFIGATYLDAEADLEGGFTFDTSGVPGLGDTTRLDYSVNQDNKDKWNYLIGFNWDVSRTWSVQAELGTGGSRDNVIASLTYRF